MFSTRKPVVLAALALAAGAGPAAVLATSASASTGAPAKAKGSGSLTLVGRSGHSRTRTGVVSCRIARGHYLATTVSRRPRHRMVARLVIAKYSGPGSYTASVRLVRFHAGAFRGHLLRDVPVTITSTGGSFHYARTLGGKPGRARAGKTISATGSWTCAA